jgi:hypothetical protein
MVCLEALYAGCAVVSFVQPFKKAIDKWHIAADESAMANQCKYLLGNNKEEPVSILPYAADDTALAVMQLFGR